MTKFSWLSKSLSRQASVLLVIILSVALLLPAYYFYHSQSKNLIDTTEQMARQLSDSLNIAIAKNVHTEEHYITWLVIKEEIKNNKRQLEHGSLYKIQEIAVLNKNRTVFSHNTPDKYPLQKIYSGVVINEVELARAENGVVISWLDTDDKEAIRIYSNLIYQGRDVGVLILQLDLSLLASQQKKRITGFIIYFLAVLILAVVIGIIFGRWISYPLHILESSMKNMGSGKLNVFGLHKRNDEYSKLAVAVESADRELYKSLAQIRLLLDSTAEAIYGVDVSGKCTFVNQACLDLLSYSSSSELLGKNMHEIIHHSYADGAPHSIDDCDIYQVFNNGQGAHAEDEIFWRKDGSHFPVEYWSHPIIDNRKCVGAVVTFFDITRRLEARFTLKEREQYLSLMLHSIGDAVIATDADGLVNRMNPVAEQLTGWSFKEAEGKPIKTIFPIINAISREPIQNPVEEVIETGDIVYLKNHTTLISKDGNEYQIADSAAPIRDADNVVQGMVLVFNDVSEQYLLRESAAKSKRDLQRIMDYTPSVIYAKDINGRYIFINKQFEKLFKFKSQNVIGMTDYDLFPAEFAKECQLHDKEVIDAGRALESEEDVLQDDGVHSYISTKFPLFNDEGFSYSVCGISTDITERKKQDEQIRRSQKMDALGKLTGGVAHDYNNILGIISGYSELLKEQLGDKPKLAKYAQDISRAARRGAVLTKRLLVFSKNKEVDVEVININDVLYNQRMMLEKSLTARVNLILKLDNELWLTKIDAGDFEDAVVNLSINSMHAMDEGGTLTIQTENTQIAELDAGMLDLTIGEYIRISLTDTGCGMDDETKDKMFDPFFSTKGEKGTGLGLSQVYGFVKRSGGAIKVYSEIGKGTSINLYFPRSLAVNTRVDEDVSDGNILVTLHGTETILVVDDEQAMVELAQDLLVARGYHVLTANDGEQALSVLENEKVDLLVSDVIMPTMDGYQLAAKIQDKYPKVKIQMVSGFSDDRHNNMVDDVLHKNMLHKPYTSKALLMRVRTILNNENMSGNVAKTITSKKTILVVDDEKDLRDLYKMNLERLGFETVLAADGDEAITFFRLSLESGVPIDVVILDLNLPGGISGQAVADNMKALSKNAKIIVSSGNTSAAEMLSYADYGFSAALEKNFDRENIKNVLEMVLALD